MQLYFFLWDCEKIASEGGVAHIEIKKTRNILKAKAGNKSRGFLEMNHFHFNLLTINVSLKAA